jgi:hypothetical protein
MKQQQQQKAHTEALTHPVFHILLFITDNTAEVDGGTSFMGGEAK